LQSVSLIVPTETEKQRTAASALRARLIIIAGGFSVYSGFGAWNDADGKACFEQHDRFEVFTNDPAAIRAAHYAYGRAAGEAVLARIVDGTPELIPVTWPAPPTWPPVSSESEHRARHDNISRRTRG